MDTQDIDWAPTEPVDWAEPAAPAVAPVAGAAPFTAPTDDWAAEVAQEQWNNTATPAPNWGGSTDWSRTRSFSSLCEKGCSPSSTEISEPVRFVEAKGTRPLNR